MITRRYALSAFGASMLAPFVPITLTAQDSVARVTVLFDAFGKPSDLKHVVPPAVAVGPSDVVHRLRSRGAGRCSPAPTR